MSSIDHIPIIDFAKYALNLDDAKEEDKRKIGEEVYEALAKAGFAYLRNTGVTEEEIQKIRKVSKDFFDLDEATKEKYIYNSEFCGYLGSEKERLNPKRPGDLNEAFDVNGFGLEPECSAIWPDEEVPEFSMKTREFCDVCKTLSLRLLEVIALGMDVKDKELFMRSHATMNLRENYTHYRALIYRPIPDSLEVKPNQVRLGEHSDFGSVTLVFQDDVGGLQVQKYDGTYIDASPVPGTVIVNIGDALEYWTQGKLKATKHRILLPNDEAMRKSERMSFAYFAKASNDTMLSEIEYGAKHVNHGAPRPTKPYQAITAGQHYEKRVHEVHDLANHEE